MFPHKKEHWMYKHTIRKENTHTHKWGASKYIYNEKLNAQVLFTDKIIIFLESICGTSPSSRYVGGQANLILAI